MADRYQEDDPLAYGDYHGPDDQGGTERGLFGDVYHRIRGRRPQEDQPDITQTYQPHLAYGQSEQSYSQPSTHQPPQSSSSGGGMAFVFEKLHSAVHGIGSEIKDRVSKKEDTHAHTHSSGECTDGTHAHNDHRFQSFAPQREGNNVKWYVDACGYMWAVSVALEQARESIWILDWWLSPELYLRRPPAKYEQYRVDRMLQAAAERGVKVNIIVYKEVTQALTLSSSHTKHALEDLHKNICVFRHPDHLPDRQTMADSFIQSVQKIRLTAATAAQLPGDTLKAIYGATDETVLYWAHHEKLCLVDGQVAFMGGLDLCYGRWDTNQHSIADVHPADVKEIVFPGQDYNNSRIMDFQDVQHWQNNKLDRTKNSRMGWSDVSLSMSGPICEDLKAHFVQRWNFIYDAKYQVRKDVKYSRLDYQPNAAGIIEAPQQSYGGYDGGGSSSHGQGGYYPPPPQQQQYRGGEEFEGEAGARGFEGEEGERGYGGEESDRGLFDHVGGFREKFKSGLQEVQGKYGEHHAGHHGAEHHYGQQPRPQMGGPRGGAACQITRSCTKWSHGVTLEHSIANAYINVIKNSQHFVYIENQFFITSTGDKQKPVKNQIGQAMVERILRAARNGEKYKMIIAIPAIPAFAGDLRSDDALSTRAIMEFQYNSINRGNGQSIYEVIAREGFNPLDYIRFYNLRSYDRINISGALREAEQRSGVPYEEARKQYDNQFGGGYATDQGGQPRGQEYQAYHPPPVELDSTPAHAEGQPYQAYNPNAGYGERPQYEGQDPLGRYQQGAQGIGSHQGLGTGRWDSVSECYMLNGEDIRNVPWTGSPQDELDAFVTEELYIHSKLLIADDRVVICGSANLNDRSQLGDHDSEIAVVIEDPTPLDSRMNGQPWRASKFAATLRRQIFKKHLGLLKPQNYAQPDDNYQPINVVGNAYDFDSPEDQQVVDPLNDEFLENWNWRAKTNTDAFARIFHPVPYDGVKTWKEYDEWYSKFFAEQKDASKKEDNNNNADKDKKKDEGDGLPKGKYKCGHVVAENFPGGAQEVKEELSKIKGTLVEMPLLFLKDEDIAQEGMGLNAFTEDIYT